MKRDYRKSFYRVTGPRLNDLPRRCDRSCQKIEESVRENGPLIHHSQTLAFGDSDEEIRTSDKKPTQILQIPMISK